jgi:hypothetical protein
MLAHSRPNFGPSNRFFRASSAFKLFEAGLWSPESPFSGQQCLQVIRGRTSVLRIAFFGPAAPLRYLRTGFGPSNYFFRASSAFKIFEVGLRSLELFLSGQQRLQDIRGRASAPRIISFGPAVPSRYSRQGFGPSNYFFWASSAFKIFEAGLRPLELFLSGQQCLQDIRGRASVHRIISFGPAVPSRYSRQGFGPSNCLFWPNDAFRVFELELWTFESSFSSLQRHRAIRV